MPNPKTGTVTDDTGRAVKEVKAGRRRVQDGRSGESARLVRQTIVRGEGNEENARAVINAVAHAKTATSKGHFIESCTISGTMSPGHQD